jgi:hypothetical protein
MNSLVAWEIKSEQAEYNEHSIAHIMSPF